MMRFRGWAASLMISGLAVWSVGCAAEEPGHEVSVSGSIVRLTRAGDVFTPAPDDSLLWPASIRKMRYDPRTGSIIALEKPAGLLVTFTPHGEFRHALGSQGGGPGEVRSIDDFAVGPNGEVALLDVGNGRVSLFDASGMFEGSFNVPLYYGIDYSPDGRLVLFPGQDGTALDIYTPDGSRSGIGRRDDLPYVCTDQLEPEPNCRSKIPCMMCSLAVLSPDRIAVIDRFQVRVLLLDSRGRVVRTFDLGRVDPMRTWLAGERERLQRYWNEGKVAHSALVLDAIALSATHLGLIVARPRGSRDGGGIWVVDTEAGAIQRFAWDRPRVGGTVAVGIDQVYTIDHEDDTVVGYRCELPPGPESASTRGGGRSPSAADCLMRLTGNRRTE